MTGRTKGNRMIFAGQLIWPDLKRREINILTSKELLVSYQGLDFTFS